MPLTAGVMLLLAPVAAAGESATGSIGLDVAEPFPEARLARKSEGSRAETRAARKPTAGPGDRATESENPFAEMDIEQLMKVQVTSVAGVKEEVFETPAAITMITPEDIRDTGHRSIAEALRLVPGMDVARINAHTWAISTRGFNSRFSNKLQVLIDGREVYDPLFSGVFWDVRNVFLPDLDRIEVVRGPGATLWGANAVNGVVNVRTKSAKQTQGLYVTGGAGTEREGFGGVRYGGQLGEDTYYRVYGQYRNHDGFVGRGGQDRPDDWDMGRGGFRIDHDGADHATVTVQGDVYGSGRIGKGVETASRSGHLATDVRNVDGRASGGNIQFRIDRDAPDSDAGWELMGYYDRRNRVAGGGFQVERDLAKLDFRQHLRPLEGHELMWGAAVRHTRDETEPTDTLAFDPASRSLTKVSAFVQDTITLIPETLHAMVGSKFEHNDHTGFEFQPSGRLWWTPDERQTVWAAISRPVRTPSRTEDDVRFTTAFADSGLLNGNPPSGMLVPLMIRGDEDSEAERLLSYEAGYRVKLTEDLRLDTAGYYNEYRQLLSPGRQGIGTFDNGGSGEAYGVETSLRWRITDRWRVRGSYSFHRLHVHGRIQPGDNEGATPQQQFQVRSSVDVMEDLSLHGALYYTDNLPAQNIPAYTRLDLGLTWRPTDRLEISVWGQNLLDPSHPEFRDAAFQDAVGEVERSVYFQASLRF